MSPHDHETTLRSTRPVPLAARWDLYLASHHQRAHHELLVALERLVRGEARRLLGSRHPLFEEVAQEAMVGAAHRISTGERPEFPEAYVRRIVNNKVADLLRRETRRRAREEQQWAPEAGPPGASVSAEWHDFLDTLRTIVSSDEFWTLILRYHFDYSYGEIGRLLDKEPNAIRQIALRGRRKCREHIGRLQGRVPAWISLPEADGGSGGAGRAGGPGGPGGPGGAGTEAGGNDRPGLRQPGSPDPADRSRRPPAGSGSGPQRPRPRSGEAAPPEPTAAAPWAIPTIRHPLPVALPARRPPPWLRLGGGRRAAGNPLTVLPLVLLVALPVLLRIGHQPVRRWESSPSTAEAVGSTEAPAGPRSGPTIPPSDRAIPPSDRAIPPSGQAIPPSGPASSVSSTAPTAPSEAPSTIVPPDPTAPRPSPTGSPASVAAGGIEVEGTGVPVASPTTAPAATAVPVAAATTTAVATSTTASATAATPPTTRATAPPTTITSTTITPTTTTPTTASTAPPTTTTTTTTTTTATPTSTSTTTAPPTTATTGTSATTAPPTVSTTATTALPRTTTAPTSTGTGSTTESRGGGSGPPVNF